MLKKPHGLPLKDAANSLYNQLRDVPGVYSVGMALDGEGLHVFLRPGTPVSAIPPTVGKYRVIAHEVDFA